MGGGGLSLKWALKVSPPHPIVAPLESSKVKREKLKSVTIPTGPPPTIFLLFLTALNKKIGLLPIMKAKRLGICLRRRHPLFILSGARFPIFDGQN